MSERLRASLASELPLRRVLFASLIDPSRKFGSFEEQTFALAREFRDRGGLFLPLYMAELGSRASAEYQAEGLSAGHRPRRRRPVRPRGKATAVIAHGPKPFW